MYLSPRPTFEVVYIRRQIYPVTLSYRKVSNIRRTKSQNLNASRLIL